MCKYFCTFAGNLYASMNILAIETSTPTCSAALLEDEKVVACRINREGSNHASLLPKFVEELLEEHPAFQIDAVALSEGPGSYTGLRIGTSLAKGLAYGKQVPLVTIPTLQIMAEGIKEKGKKCPMIDARRMEVYTALFAEDGTPLSEVTALIVDETSFAEELEQGRVVFFGDGAAKCKSVIRHKNAVFVDGIVPDACNIGRLTEEKLKRGETADLAYFEPFYLKEFVAAPSHIKGLNS